MEKKPASKQVAANDVSRGIKVIRLIIPILGIVGIGISSYLTYVHYEGVSAICLGITHCDVVLSSPYSVMWGIPLSIPGLVMYGTLTTLGFWQLRAEKESQSLLALEIYMIALAGILFTAYLYYLEIFVIHAFCTWCVASSIVLATILVLSLNNLNASGQYLKEVPRFVRVRVSRYIRW